MTLALESQIRAGEDDGCGINELLRQRLGEGAERSVVRGGEGKGRQEVNSVEKGVEGCPSASVKESLNRFPCPGGGFRRINS
jgi:hypothetical protein